MNDVVLIETERFDDERGFFMELHRDSEFRSHGLLLNSVQVNYSKSKKRVLRGLHYQLRPFEQGKLVTVIGDGMIYDVAVDLRRGSKTFGMWVGAEVKEGLMLWVPPGFAHGFMSLEDDTRVVYYVTGSEYNRESERGIIWNDPQIGVKWPMQSPILSRKDSGFPRLGSAEINFEVL